jgi:ketosteroid isomerase-like protein
LVLETFAAVERRDMARLSELYHPEVEFHWPPSLPPSFAAVYAANYLQPTEAERRMSPRVVAATDDEVVVIWRWRGLSTTGDRFESEVLGLYGVRDGKFASAQMFFFDTTGVIDFIIHADRQSVA